ncbi:MAG: hypothetical protein NWE98_05895 [Candidatus Bathyarchaeota archaeon]|nr:hypothetical protein [Candidatus Bathyarchaeota archaeon]
MNRQADGQIKRIVVLDTSAFVAGYDPFSLGVEQVTVPKVEEEIRRNSMVKMRLQTAVENGKLQVIAPSEVYSRQIKSYAGKIGDVWKLSETDMQLLALALQLKSEGFKPQVISDDYSIQNVAKQMGVEFLSLATFGIKRPLEWMRYCPACHREYPADSKSNECQVCGTELKRKPRKQRTK